MDLNQTKEFAKLLPSTARFVPCYLSEENQLLPQVKWDKAWDLDDLLEYNKPNKQAGFACILGSIDCIGIDEDYHSDHYNETNHPMLFLYDKGLPYNTLSVKTPSKGNHKYYFIEKGQVENHTGSALSSMLHFIDEDVTKNWREYCDTLPKDKHDKPITEIDYRSGNGLLFLPGSERKHGQYTWDKELGSEIKAFPFCIRKTNRVKSNQSFAIQLKQMIKEGPGENRNDWFRDLMFRVAHLNQTFESFTPTLLDLLAKQKDKGNNPFITIEDCLTMYDSAKIKYLASRSIFTELSDKYFYHMASASFYSKIDITVKPVPIASMRNMYTTAIVKELMTLPEIVKVRDIVYEPDGNRILTHERDKDLLMWNSYNAPSKYESEEPCDESNVYFETFKKAFSMVFQTGESYTYKDQNGEEQTIDSLTLAKSWFINIIRKPKSRMQYSINIISNKQGNSKDLTIRVISELLGPENYKPIRAGELSTTFNSVFTDSLLVGMSDVQAIKKGSKEFNSFKSITGAEKLLVDEKFEKKSVRPIRCNFIAAANEKANHAIDTGDRRWAIWKPKGGMLIGTELSKMGQLCRSPKDPILDEMIRYDALSQIKNWLTCENWEELGKINIAPMSDGKRELDWDSRPAWERILITAIKDGISVFNQRVITADTIEIYYTAYPDRFAPKDPTEILNTLATDELIKPIEYPRKNGYMMKYIRCNKAVLNKDNGDRIEFLPKATGASSTKIYAYKDTDISDLNTEPLIKAEYGKIVNAFSTVGTV